MQVAPRCRTGFAHVGLQVKSPAYGDFNRRIILISPVEDHPLLQWSRAIAQEPRDTGMILGSGMEQMWMAEQDISRGGRGFDHPQCCPIEWIGLMPKALNPASIRHPGGPVGCEIAHPRMAPMAQCQGII
jgi:hypothetical protein